MRVSEDVLASFFEVLVDEIRSRRPEYLTEPFTVAEIYQELVPYPTHRDRIGVEMNGDYEDALMRLLAGEGGYLELDSDQAVRRLRSELQGSNPNTGVYREFAAVDVRLADPQEERPSGSSRGPETADRLEEMAAGAGVGRPPRSDQPPHHDGASRVSTRDDLKFCPYCGTSVSSVPCGSCGAEMEADWRFCIACGAQQGS